MRFDVLVRPHLDRLYRLAYRFTQSPDDAEDLVQDLLVKMIPRAAQIAGLDRPGPWLAGALYHRFIDQTRQRGRRTAAIGRPVNDEPASESPEDRDGEAFEDDVERNHQADRLRTALAALSREHRAVIAWHDIEGYTLEALTVDHGVTIGTLKSRLHGARAHLRALLAAESLPAAAHPPDMDPETPG